MLIPRGRGGHDRHSGHSDGTAVPAVRARWPQPSSVVQRRRAPAGAWPAAAGTGVVAAALALWADAGGLDPAAVAAPAELLAAGAALAGAWRLRPDRAAPWWLAGAGLAISGAGRTLAAAPAVAAVVDAALLARVAAVVGLGLGVAAAGSVVAVHARRRAVAPLLSAAAAVLAVVLVAAEALRPLVAMPATALPPVLLALAALLGAVALHRWRRPGAAAGAGRLLIGAAGTWLAHEALAVAPPAVGGAAAGAAEALAALSLGLLAAACWHPAAPGLVEPPAAGEPAGLEPPARMWHIAALGSGLLVLPLVSLSLALREPAGPGWVWLMAAGMVALIALVLLRLRGLVRWLRAAVALRHAEARSDVATGLPNARALLEDLQQRVVAGGGRAGRPALLVVALTGVGEAESVHGFPARAELLRTLADRLAAAVPAEATIAVLSRRNLAVALGDVDEARLAPLGATLRRLALRPVALPAGVVSCGAVVGVATHEPGQTPETLLRRAELASRWAKRAGAHRVQRYELAMISRLSYEVSIRTRIRQAVADDELQLWCQPQLELATGRLAGVECLARWRDPRHGYVSPAEFVPAARDAGVAAELDARMVSAAVRQAARWRDAGMFVPSVAVNVEPTTLSQPGFVDEVAAVLDRAGVAPATLEIELTEAVTAHDHDQARDVLWGLRRLGVRLAVDDFGTGYSSLADLHHLPMDGLKLDRELISVVEEEPVLVTASIALADRLGLRLIAEGVETSPQLMRLQRLGCEVAQGFLLARPMPVEALAGWRRRQATWSATRRAADARGSAVT